MARGFESKSVESQQLDRDLPGQRKPKLSREEIELAHKRESIEMSRRQVSAELANAKSPVHRAALENALKFLDDELKAFHQPDQL
ncbi:MAG: hypothetical protein JJE51_01390 [Thermoanaerobaculia bacterium]|nr:hypothetical protein [Thermoanaerobaculia bacterium]